MSSKVFKVLALLTLTLCLCSAAVFAQGAEVAAPVIEPFEEGPQVAINVPSDGVLYNERGELVVSATLTNVGGQTVPPLDVVVVLLNDCILTNVPQTCRFAAFGSFEGVAPNGIASNNSLQWVFNFGPYPRLDLDRWTVIWYPVVSALATANAE